MFQLKTFLFLLYSTLLLVLAYLAVLVTAYKYENIKALAAIVYCEWGFYRYPIALFATDFTLLRAGVYIPFAFLGLLWLVPAHRAMLTKEARLLYQEVQQAANAVAQQARQLSGSAWLLILGIFVVFAAAKVYFLLKTPLLSDETASFDYFVMEGIEAATSFYPIPNNHVFQNFLNYLLYQLYPDIYFSVRGTSFLISTIGLLFLFLLLCRIINFRTSIIFVVLISAAYTPFHFSTTGRGYSLLLILAGIGFICTYYLLRPGYTVSRLCYSVLVLSSILGLYTVPTHLYAFATYMLVLFVAYLFRRQYRGLVFLVGAGILVGLATLTLYAPILLVTGPKSLFGNSYITPQDTVTILAGLKNYFMLLEGSIVGQERVGWVLSLLVMLMAAGLVATGYLNEQQKLLCALALAGMLVPYALIVVQGVLPPERTMAYKAFYFFLLTAILADTLTDRLIKNRQLAAMSLATLVIVYAAYELSISYRFMKRMQPREQSIKQVWQQVSSLAPASVFISQPSYQLFILHHAKTTGQSFDFYSNFEEAKGYDVLIVGPDNPVPPHVFQTYTRTFSDAQIAVYRKKP